MTRTRSWSKKVSPPSDQFNDPFSPQWFCVVLTAPNARLSLHNHGIRKINVFLTVGAGKLDYEHTQSRQTSHTFALQFSLSTRREWRRSARQHRLHNDPQQLLVPFLFLIMCLSNFLKIVCVTHADCLPRESGPTCVRSALNASTTT